MNKPRLIEIMQWLEDGAMHENVTFNMCKGLIIESLPFDTKAPATCRSTCCIAGAAVQFFEPDWALDQVSEDNLGNELRFTGNNGVFWRARDLLGLTDEQARKLFTPVHGTGNGFSSCAVGERMYAEFNDPKWAARTIAYLLATGKVDWEATRENR